MVNSPLSQSKSSFPLVLAAAIITWIYWLYLASTSQMLIVQDATGYERLGQQLVDHGWKQYFLTGPNREPVYPFLFASAMRLSQIFGWAYQSVLVIFQVGILLCAQLILAEVLRRSGVRQWLQAMAVLYFGLSPAVVNSAMSGFSEVATYGFMAGILWSIKVFLDGLKDESRRTGIICGIIMGASFLGIALVKAVYETIFPVLLLVFCAAFCRERVLRRATQANNWLILIVSAGLIFFTGINAFKLTNKIYNGHFVVTTRGDMVLYHSASLRQQPLTPRILWADLVSIPGQDFCARILGTEKCEFWTTRHLESFGHDPILAEDLIALPEHSRAGFIRQQAAQKIFAQPVQFTGLMLVDMLKLFFWDSMQVGFVTYPKGIEKIFSLFWLDITWRLVSAAFSLAAFIYALKKATDLCRYWRRTDVFEGNTFCLLLVCVAGMHLLIYAFCAAFVQRHALPLAPLFVLLIAMTLER